MIEVFTNYVPDASVAYCQELWEYYQFNFQVSKPRRTRLGDFRVLPHNQTQITVNTNLNPHAFLITYVHEVAHADVHKQYKTQQRSRIRPHGNAWQSAFRRLMQPLLTEAVFPLTILQPLCQYLIKPAATTYANTALMLALRQADTICMASSSGNQVTLRDVAEGEQFHFSKKTFIRGTLRRTRIVCKEVSSGKSYAILAHALVEIG